MGGFCISFVNFGATYAIIVTGVRVKVGFRGCNKICVGVLRLGLFAIFVARVLRTAAHRQGAKRQFGM
jgi:hypothetical protein